MIRLLIDYVAYPSIFFNREQVLNDKTPLGKAMTQPANPELHEQMRQAVKQKALSILKMDEKVKRLSQDIDDGDTNLLSSFASL